MVLLGGWKVKFNGTYYLVSTINGDRWVDVENDEIYFEKEKLMEYLMGVRYCDLG